jgi:hypothetical protein
MKVRMNLCGRTIVVPLETANEIMEAAFLYGEIIEEKWNRGENGAESFYTTHVYEIDPSKFNFSPELITDGQYQMFKLAGKPKN